MSAMQAAAMVGPAALLTGVSALLLPPRIHVRLPDDGSARGRDRDGVLLANTVLGMLLVGVTISFVMLLPGAFSQNAVLEVVYLLGGLVAIGVTALALATVIVAIRYRYRNRGGQAGRGR